MSYYPRLSALGILLFFISIPFALIILAVHALAIAISLPFRRW